MFIIPDPAHNQRDERRTCQQRGEHLRGLLHRLHELALIEHTEIGVAPRRNIVGAHGGLFDTGLGVKHLVGAPRLYIQRVQMVLSAEAAHAGCDGNINPVVRLRKPVSPL